MAIFAPGCFRSIDYKGYACDKEHLCPPGYECISPSSTKEGKGVCCQEGTTCEGLKDASRTSGAIAPGIADAKKDAVQSGKPGDGSFSDVPQSNGGSTASQLDKGGMGDAQAGTNEPTGSTTNDPSKVRNGDTCALDVECGSGHCVEKVCCDGACGESCFACKQSLSGKPDGTCAPVGSGKRDPKDFCKDETEKNQCGNDGVCDGTGACRKVGTDHICKTSACEGTKFVPTSTCDGKGACKTVDPAECGAALCDRVDGCKIACKTAEECNQSTSYCNVAMERCAAKKIDGDSCKDKTECQSGFCIDGVCCKTECKDACKACSMVLTGQASGTCQPAKTGTDPHESCVDEPGCGNDGTCDGAGACRKRGTDSVCSPASCSSAGNKYSFSAMCNGKGACQTPKIQDCGSILCDDKVGCATTCTTDTDCASGTYCNKGICAPKLVLGTPCVAANECASANCVEGVCCDGKCDAACYSCKKDLTGEKTDGVCATVDTGKKDSKNSCTDERLAKKCGQDGNCNGSGACKKVDKGIGCGEPICDANKFIAEATCDGAGKCSIPAAHDCGIYPCATTGCQTSCTTDKDCGGSTYCSTNKCVAKLANGKACSAANACTSGNCVEGVCCKDATCPTCNSCKVAGKEGTCAAVAKGAKDANCSGTAPCGQNGTCDSGGKCFYPDSAVKCGATCSGWTLTDKTCSGDGFCSGLASSGKSCAGSLICADANTCRKDCTLDKHCAGDTYCSNGKCVAQLGPGGNCGTSSNMCQSGLCITGYCCKNTCGPCEKCNSSGNCETTCAADEKCANNSCVMCGTVGITCCGTSCSDGSKCVTGICKLNQGAKCSGASQCETGDCVDGVCCNDGCSGLCKACNVSGKVGLCSNVANGSEDSGCTTDATGICLPGTCEAGTCKKASTSTVCAPAKCTNNSFIAASKCNSTGNCSQPGLSSCSPYTCTTSGCMESCTQDAHCESGRCSINGKCEACGGLTQPCCAGSDCGNFSCQNKVCAISCGGPNQPCCTSGTACTTANYSCKESTCQPQCTLDLDCWGVKLAECIRYSCAAGKCVYDDSFCGCQTNEDCDDGDPCTRDLCFSSTMKCINYKDGC